MSRSLGREGLPPTYVEGFHDSTSCKAMEYRELGRTDMMVSALAFGASSIAGVFRDTSDEESIEVVQEALKNGINLIDTAPWYGNGKSEELLGRALRGIPRKAYYINTKVGRYSPREEEMFDFRASRVTESVHESLARLGLSYIDVCQVHDVEFAPSIDIILQETLPALQALKEKRLIRFIGITGYPLGVLEHFIRASTVPIDTCLSYCHYTLQDTTLQDSLLPLLESKGVGLVNASAMAMGLLTPQGPPEWHPATDEQKKACRQALEYCTAQGVDISRIALKFTLSNPRIPATLVSTASPAELRANLHAIHTPLTEEECEVMQHVRGSFLAALKGRETWEGREVARYWEAIGKRYILRVIYGKCDG